MLSSRLLNALFLGCALLVAGCDRQSAAPAQGEPKASPAPAASGTIDRSRKGSALPDFTVKDGNGNRLAIGSLKGRPLLINLWATWCAPCVAELPALDRLASKDAVRVVTVSQDMQKLESVPPFLKARGVTRLEPWIDPDNELGFHYEATLPTSILYDAQGREVWRVSGPLEWDSDEVARLIAEAG